MDENDPLLAMKAANRLNALRSGYPAVGPGGRSRFIRPPEPIPGIDLEDIQGSIQNSTLARMLSRFLRPGQQTRPATAPQPGITGEE